VVLALALLASVGAATPGRRATVAVVSGELLHAGASVCEYPLGVYLLDYVSGGCGREIFFAGPGFPTGGDHAGATIWTSGELVQSNSCTVLVVQRYELCDGPDPD